MSSSEPTPVKTLFLSVQHVLAMYAAAVVVPLIVGRSIGLNQEQLTYLIAIDIFMCGIATILQAIKNRFFGIGLPIVLGCTFTAVGPMIAIGNAYGVTAIYGAILVAGAALFLSSTAFGALVHFFPPVVTGSLVLIIGITLVPVAIHDMAGGVGAPNYGHLSNLGLGFGVLAIILTVYRLFRGFARSIAVLIGLLAGTMAAAYQGGVILSPVYEASWFHVPEFFYFGAPTFHAVPIVTMLLVVVIGVVEAAGVYLAVSDICGVRLTKDDIARGYRAEGLAIMLGGLFNAFPYTTYSQNVGLVQLSGVRTSRVG